MLIRGKFGSLSLKFSAFKGWLLIWSASGVLQFGFEKRRGEKGGGLPGKNRL